MRKWQESERTEKTLPVTNSLNRQICKLLVEKEEMQKGISDPLSSCDAQPDALVGPKGT